MSIPQSQQAIQFVGKDRIQVNPDKPVDNVGPHQLLLQVEACGVCFSDTKLLHAFDSHPRKSAVASGLSLSVLEEIPSYHPGTQATVPGHEPVGKIVAVGDKVSHFRVGDRVLVQADWKHLPTEKSNAAFGYNFEGALQEYVVIDERCVVTEAGEKYLLPVAESPSAASIGLIEPWATVEGAYARTERRAPLPGGQMLVVVDQGVTVVGLEELIEQYQPGQVVRATVGEVEGQLFDDIIYFGSDAPTAGALGRLLGNHALLNVVLGGKQFDQSVEIDVGRVHYDFIRYCGTTGSDPMQGYAWIPATPQIRGGDKIAIIGAAGPMGLMHTVRAASLDLPGLSIDATDLSDDRLTNLEAVVGPIASAKNVPISYVNTGRESLPGGYTYVVCMVPVGALVEQGVQLAAKKAIVNAFAGIPAGTVTPMDLQRIIENQILLTGSSGSTTDDMATVLGKIESGSLDTTIVLDAVCGMVGFVDVIRAVEERTSGGKIMVYPMLHDLPLTRLVDLKEKLPAVAAKLDDGKWTVAAERELLRS